MIDFAAIADTARPMPMPWAAFEARARKEGIWDQVLATGVDAGMVGAESALQNTTLPSWAQEIVRAQFPARIE